MSDGKKLAALISLIVLTLQFSIAAGESGEKDDEFKNVREIRAVETYVPYEEFLQITGKEPNATVMTLEEYRGLVEMATARNGEAKTPTPPPIDTSLMEAVYVATVGETSARFDVQFKFSVTGKGWKRCDLGPLQNLGHVMLDGKPGWVVVESNRATLLVNGEGLHSGTLSFALPLQINEDVQSLSGNLLFAAASRMTVTVPGRVVPKSGDVPLDAKVDTERDNTTFNVPVVPAGNLSQFAVSWKRKFDAQKSTALLQAEHSISYLLNPQSPAFMWESKIQVSRGRAAEFAFTEPQGCSVVRLSGALVHSWRRENGLVYVLLNDSIQGEFSFVAAGYMDPLTPPKDSFELTAPELKDARRNTRYMALYEPDGLLLSMVKNDGLRELALDERPEIPFPGYRLMRSFFVEKSGALAVVKAGAWKSVFDTQTTASIVIREKELRLSCAISVQPERGKMYTLNLAVPAFWKIERIQERTQGSAARVLRAEKSKADLEDEWLLTLKDAADAGHPLEFLATFVPRDREKVEAAWENFSLAFVLPAVSGARRSGNYLAVAAQSSVEISTAAMPGWRSTSPGELARLGIDETGLRAGLASELPGAEVKFDLSRKVPRGEYESLTHVQTMERELWVRADIRLVLMDRALDELTFTIPAEAVEPINVTGPGVLEITAGKSVTQKVVRFSQPWQGSRILRVEYRAPLVAGKDVPVPDILIEGNFDSKRGVIFQSAGVVSLEIKPGESLVPAAVDDKPEFAIPFKAGRTLFAYTFAQGGKNGTFKTLNLERSATLGILASELKLVTVLDASGMARTHVDFLLEYARIPYAQIRLPDGARLIALRVDGENVRPVREAKGAGEARGVKTESKHTSDENLVSVPLPTRSQARVELVLERAYKNLGGFGTLEVEAPDLEGIPVAVTKWSIYHPAEFKFAATGGNVTQAAQREPQYLATQWYSRLINGMLPSWSAWTLEQRDAEVDLSSSNSQVRPQTPQQVQQAVSPNNLKAIENQGINRDAARERSVGGLALPEGVELQIEKLGGSARARLSYHHIGFGGFARRAAFFVALLGGIWLLTRRSMRTAFYYLLAGLLLGILVPLALEWESPLLMIPFCEGLCAFAVVLLLAWIWRGLRSAKLARAKNLAARSALVLICFGALGHSARAGETEAVLIPYPKAGALPLDADPKSTKVYVPKSVYLDLMKRVKPEKKEPEIDAPKTLDAKPEIVPVSLGNAEYSATIKDNAYVINGRLEANTYNPKGWAKLYLDTGASRLTEVKIDGLPAGVSNENGRLFVVLKGAKQYAIELELVGALELQAGRARLSAQVVPGGATKVSVSLPTGVVLDPKSLPPGAWVEKNADGSPRSCEINLGGNGALSLAWHSPDIGAPGKTQLASSSYTRFELGADGYALARSERVTANGNPVDQLSYRILGEWEIANVASQGLAEWAINGEGASRRLRLWFRKPVNEATVQVEGWAPLESASANVAGLSLDGALREEGFIGLKHGAGRRFSAAALDGLKRASVQELSEAVSLPEGGAPDRIVHFYESPEAQKVSAENEPLQTALETQVIGLIQSEKMLVSVRTQYSSAGRAPLRHEVELPAGWEVRTVRGNALREWEIVENAGARKLVVYFNGRAGTGTEVLWSAEVPLKIPATGSLKVDLPQPRASAFVKSGEILKAGESSKITETVEWVLAAEAALSVSQSPETTMQNQPVDRAPRWVSLSDGLTYRLAFRSLKPESKLSVEIARQIGTAQAVVVSFVRAAEDHLQVNVRVKYKIEGAGRERFSLTLPVGAKLYSLDAKNLRGREVVAKPNGGTVVNVLMQSPVSGEQIIDLSYRLPREAGKDASASPVVIDPGEVQTVDHFAGLLQMDRGVVELAGARHLNRVKDAEELPFLPENVSKSALAMAFSAEADWVMTLRQPGVKTETGQAAEVTFAELKTALGSDGSVRTRAEYSVRNRSLQFLPILMPPDAQLWAVFVGGLPATVSHETRNGQDVLLIPLHRMGLVDLPVKIAVVFESARLALPASLTTFAPKAPRVLDAPVAETYWTLYLPAEYEVSQSGGNMKEVLGSVLYGGKLKSNISEIERLTKIADAPEQSGSYRARALGNLMQLQQELDDNVSALNVQDEKQTQSYLKRNKNEDVQSQIGFNNDNLRLGNAWQGKLNARGKEIEAAAKGGQDSEQARFFQDYYSFLGNQWRVGQLNRDGISGKPVAGTGVAVQDLRFMRRPAGYQPGEFTVKFGGEEQQPAGTCTGVEFSEERKDILTTGGGLVDFKRIEEAAQELRMTTLTFSRSVEGYPEVSLSLRSTRATSQYAAIALLILLGAIVWFVARRKSAR